MFLNKLIPNQNTKQLIINICTLMVLQGANYVLPLITFPYLMRTLGLETYGLLAFASATVAYFGMFTDYGFNLSATRQVAIHRDNPQQINRLFSTVLIIKVGIMLTSFILLVILINNIPKFQQHKILYLINFGSIIGQVLSPSWFFQGIEKMSYFHIGLISKILSIACIFLCIHSSQDYLILPIIGTVTSIIVGCVYFYIVIHNFHVRFIMPSYKEIVYQLTEGWYIFSSSLAISIYTISTTFVLGLFTNNIIVGQFAVANRIIKVCTSLQQPISQALYPFISKKIAQNRIAGTAIALKYTYWVALGILCACILIVIFSTNIVGLLVGKRDDMIVCLIRIMAITPVLVTLSDTYAIKLMLNLGLQKAYNRIYFGVALGGMILATILIPLYQAIGVSISIVIIEATVALTTYLYLKYVAKIIA